MSDKDCQRFDCSLTSDKRGLLLVPMDLSTDDLVLICKQIELLSMQVEINVSNSAQAVDEGEGGGER